MYNGPPRPGARGGRGEFSWDKVVQDKDREYYLGHSVKALAGRWQKGRDVYWYTRGKDQGNTLQDEIRAVKEREEQMMMEALGLKPKSAPAVHQPMDANELAAVLKKTARDQEEQTAGDKEEAASAMKGLGFSAGLAKAPSGAVDHTMELGGTLQGEGTLPPQQPSHSRPVADSKAASGKLPGPPGGGGAMLLQMLASGMRLTSAQLKELAKHDKKAVKKAKKEAKQARKEAKKGKKRAKERSKEEERDGLPASKRARKDSDSEDEHEMQHRSLQHTQHEPRPEGHDSRAEDLRLHQQQRGRDSRYSNGTGFKDDGHTRERYAGVHQQDGHGRQHEHYHVQGRGNDSARRTDDRRERDMPRQRHDSDDDDRRHAKGYCEGSPHARPDRQPQPSHRSARDRHHRSRSRSRQRHAERSRSPAQRYRDRSPRNTVPERHASRGDRVDGRRGDRVDGRRDRDRGRQDGDENARKAAPRRDVQERHDAAPLTRRRSRSASRKRSRDRGRSSSSSDSSGSSSSSERS